MYDVCVGYLIARRDGQRCVLLGEKQRGLGDGKVVAPGGKLEPGETALDAMVRELQEETGIELAPENLREVAIVNYTFPTQPSLSQRSHVFVADEVPGDPVDSDELRNWWCPVNDVPYERMWDDAKRWVPHVLDGATGLELNYTFGADLNTVVDERVTGNGRP